MAPQANGSGGGDGGDGDREGVSSSVTTRVGRGFTLSVDRATRELDGRTLFTGCSFELGPREILFISGPSGVGKTLLLRSIACLDDLQGGVLTLNGKTPAQIGFPTWRAQVCYVPQSRVNFPGTPTELYFSAQQFSSQKGRPRGDLPALVHEMGLEQVVLNQTWSTLSGGQAQRVAIAIALALCPLVLLLDEPTSALDPVSTRRVERIVRDSGAAAVWVTHDEEQPSRVGGRMLELPHMRLVTLPPPPPDRALPPAAGSAASLCASDVATDA